VAQVIQEPAETVIRDSSGRVLDRWVESDDDDPCCDECLAWATGADVDEQTKQHALQDAINAAFERLKKVSISYSLPQGLFVIRNQDKPNDGGIVMNDERFIVVSEQYGQVQMVSTYVHTRQGADELARLHRRAVYGENCDVYVAEVLERKS
jgi:hypothetical protein